MRQELEQLLADADAALSAGETAKAEPLYRSVLEQQPDSASAHYALGTIAFQRKDHQAALNSLNTAAEIEPEAVDIAFNFAACLADTGNRLGALIQLQRATEHCGDDPVFCQRIAELSVRLGEPAAAITLLSRLDQLLPADQIILANAQGRLGNWREAVNILKRLNDSVPNDPKMADNLATAAGKLRDYPTAISAFERYLRLVKPTARDYLRFADLLLIAQNSERCDQALDIALDMGEDGPEVYLLKARTARLRGDYDAVNIALDNTLQRQPNHGQAWAIRAELADDEQLDNLIESLQKELEKKEEIAQLNHRHQALLYYSLADMQDRNSNYAEAAEALKQANLVQHTVLEMTNGEYRKETTEAQFDHYIEDFNSDVLERADSHISADATEITPIFIVGMPRSGTTLVERILGQNQQVFNAGEEEAMEFVAVDFRQQRSTGKLSHPSEIASEQWAALRKAYLEKLPNISKPIFTDKLPHNFRNVGLILKLFPDARVIQMHRSKLDVCLSVYSHAFAPGHNYANRWEDLNHFYDQSERLMAHWSGLHSSRLLNLKYENLVQNPEHYAKQLVEFCGFQWDASYLDFHQSVNQSFTFSEMQVRQPIATTRIDRWRNYQPHIRGLSELSEK